MYFKFVLACSSTSLSPIKVKKSDQAHTATGTVLDDVTESRPFNTSHSDYTNNEMFQSITSM